MSRRRVAMPALAVTLACGAGIALVAVKQSRPPPVISAEASASPGTRAGTKGDATVHAATTDDTANSNRKSAQQDRRIVVPANDRDRILVDVPGERIDHADLEEFLEKRPMDAYRIVHVDSDALRAVVRQAGQQPSFELQVLSPSPITLVAKEAKEHTSDWQAGIAAWRGTVAGDKYSDATFVIAPDGSVHSGISSRETGLITIEPVPNTPYHIVWRLEKGFERRID